MADNRLAYSITNPVKLMPVVTPLYDNFDNAPYKRLSPGWLKPVPYRQKWWNDGVSYDLINLQMHSTFGAPYIQVINCKGRVIQTINGIATPNSSTKLPWVTYQFSFAAPVLTGVYYFLLTVGAGPTLMQMISEPQQTITDKKNTLLFRYYNTFNYFNIVFSTGLQYYFRCEGGFGRPIFKSKGADWEDQPLNLETISGRSYREFPLILGNSYGVPDWVPDKANHILVCDTVFINEKRFTKPNGNEFEVNEDANYPMAGFVVIVRETLNSDSMLIENSENPSLFTFTAYDIETAAFGTMNDNGINNPVQIIKIN